jgi:hypothetical protein
VSAPGDTCRLEALASAVCIPLTRAILSSRWAQAKNDPSNLLSYTGYGSSASEERLAGETVHCWHDYIHERYVACSCRTPPLWHTSGHANSWCLHHPNLPHVMHCLDPSTLTRRIFAMYLGTGHMHEPLQSTRARIANRMNCKDGSKHKEPKAPRTTLRGTKSSHNQHKNTTHTRKCSIKVGIVRSRQHQPP